MEGYVVETPIGLFVVDEKSKVLQQIMFADDPQTAAEQLRGIQEGRVSPPLLNRLKETGCTALIFESEALAKAIEKQSGVHASIRTSPLVEEFRNRLSQDWDGRREWLNEQSLHAEVLKTPTNYNNFARQVALQLARTGVARAAAKRDLSAVQAVRAMDDIDKTLNLLAGRVREWYGLHFPEMDRAVEKHDTYARLVAKLGNRRNFTNGNLVTEGIPQEKAHQLAEIARKSMGAEIDDNDLAVLQTFCNLMLDLYKFRERSESYVDDVLKQVAPNMSAIVGASLSARLISIAGSLENLAKMPASTLQVLGAEKALFRSLKTGARPPKHGVIFQHTSVHMSPRWQRGKIARAIAGKLSIGARIDSFGGDFLGEKLRDDVTKKVEEIKERYKTAPPPKKKDFGRKR